MAEILARPHPVEVSRRLGTYEQIRIGTATTPTVGHDFILCSCARVGDGARAAFASATVHAASCRALHRQQKRRGTGGRARVCSDDGVFLRCKLPVALLLAGLASGVWANEGWVTRATIGHALSAPDQLVLHGLKLRLCRGRLARLVDALRPL